MPNNDDLADALSAMSRGDVPPPRSGPPVTPRATTPVNVPAPVSPKPIAPPAAAAPPPAIPDEPRRVRPSMPGRPTAPQAAVPPTAARSTAPQAPLPIAPNLTPPVPPESLDDIVFDEDDDSSAVPEMARTGPTRKVKAPPRPSRMQSMGLKQTLIPILLTVGVIALISAAMPYVLPAGSPIGGLKDSPGLVAMLALIGLAVLAVAGANIAQVNAAMKADKRR